MGLGFKMFLFLLSLPLVSPTTPTHTSTHTPVIINFLLFFHLLLLKVNREWVCSLIIVFSSVYWLSVSLVGADVFRRREAFIKCTLLRHQLTLLTLTDARNSTLRCNFYLLLSMEGDEMHAVSLSLTHTLFAFDETLSQIHLNPFTMKSFSIIPALPS